MTPSNLRRQVAAVNAAANLGRPTLQTQLAIDQHRAAYAAKRAAKSANIVVTWPQVDRRVAERRAGERRSTQELLDDQAAKASQRRFSGQLPSLFGALL